MARRREREERLTEGQRRELLDLHPPAFGHLWDPELSAFTSKAAKRAAWAANCAELLEEHARQLPGTRPLAWWTWSAPDDLDPPEIPAELAPWASSFPSDPALRIYLLGAGAEREALEARGLLFTFEVEALEGDEK